MPLSKKSNEPAVVGLYYLVYNNQYETAIKDRYRAVKDPRIDKEENFQYKVGIKGNGVTTGLYLSSFS